MVDRPLSYAIVSKMVGNPPTMIGFVVAKCGSCGAEEQVQWRHHHNPNHISTHFKQKLNWDFDVYRPAKCRCPDCRQAKPEGDQRLLNFETFGARFRWTREQAHLKRDDIAQETGINPTVLEFLESGRQSIFNLDPSSTNKLIESLKNHGASVERDWLLGTSQQSSQLARNLKREMERGSFTEGALADRSHCSISAIKQILSGTIPFHYKLPDIAKVLRTTTEKLLGVPEPIFDVVKPKTAATPVWHRASRDIGEPPQAPPSRVLPSVPETPPVVISKPIEVPDDATPGQRLKAARLAKDLSQARLAKAIRAHTEQWTEMTLIWIISNVEHHNHEAVGRIILMGIIGQILDVSPEWLLGRTNEQQSGKISKPSEPESAPVPVPAPEVEVPEEVLPVEAALPVVTSLALEEADEIRRQLEMAESSMGELKVMIDDRLNDITALRDLFEETRETVDDLRTRFTANVALTAIPEAAPIPEANDEPSPPPLLVPVETAPPPPPPSNGHHFPPVVQAGDDGQWAGTIDRTAETKQNFFARALRRNVRNKYLTMDVIFTKLRDVIDELKPPTCNNENLYIHAMMRREVIARNGLLEKVGRGVWQYRENAHI